MHTTGKLTLNPFARLPGVATDHESQPPRQIIRTLHRTHQRPAQPRDGLVIERIFSGLSTDTVSAKKSMGHVGRSSHSRTT